MIKFNTMFHPKKNPEKWIVLFILLLAFSLRLYLSSFDGYKVDIGTFKAWSLAVVDLGIPDFYSNLWCDYPPLYIYILGVIGFIYKSLLSTSPDVFFTTLIKMPANIADVLIAYVLYIVLRNETDVKIALFGMISYAFNPALIYNAAVWGQVEAVSTLFIFLSVLFIYYKKPELSCVFLTISILTKLICAIMLPLIAFLVIKKYKNDIRRIASSAVLSVLTFLAIVLPFFYKTPSKLISVYMGGYDYYKYTSLNAFNVWSLFGFWKPDDQTFLFLSFKTWGIILFLSLMGYVIYSLNGENLFSINFSSYILFLGFYMLVTRIHERYLFTAFVFLALCAWLACDKKLIASYVILTITYLVNLFYALTLLNADKFMSCNPLTYSLTLLNIGVLIFSVYRLTRIPKKGVIEHEA